MKNTKEKTIYINETFINAENALRSIHSINNGSIAYTNSEDEEDVIELPFNKGQVALDDFISFISTKTGISKKYLKDQNVVFFKFKRGFRISYGKVFAIVNEMYLNKNYRKEFYDTCDFTEEYNSVQGYMDCYRYMTLEEIYEKIRNHFNVKHADGFIKYHACISKPDDVRHNIGFIRRSNKDFVIIEPGYYYLDYITRRIMEHVSGKIDLKEINNPLLKEDAENSKAQIIHLGEKHYYISELVTKEIYRKYPDAAEKMYLDINVKYDDVYAGYYGIYDDVSSWN